MIIDFHTHIFPDKIAKRAISRLSESSNEIPYTDGTIEGLRNSMKLGHIDLSVILPVVTNPVKATAINENAARINEISDKTGIISFGGIHPDTTNYYEVLKEAKAIGLKGIKLHPDYYQVAFDDIRMMRIMDKASELGLTIVTHAGKDIGLYPPVNCTPNQVLNVCRTVNPEKLVLAHMGGWQMWDEVIEKLAETKVYIDTAFSIGKINWKDQSKKKDFYMLTNREFVNMVRIFGSKRVLFATDSPWAGQKEYVEIIEGMPFSEEEKEDIFWKNAMGLL